MPNKTLISPQGQKVPSQSLQRLRFCQDVMLKFYLNDSERQKKIVYFKRLKGQNYKFGITFSLHELLNDQHAISVTSYTVRI